MPLPPLLLLQSSSSSSQPRRRTARRVVRRRSSVRAQRVRACVLARRCVPRKEEKRVPAKEGRNSETRKRLRAYCKAGMPNSGIVPVGARRLLRLLSFTKNPRDSSPVQRRQLRARVRARSAVLVPVAACGGGAAAMQLRARARTNGYGSARGGTWRCARRVVCGAERSKRRHASRTRASPRTRGDAAAGSGLSSWSAGEERGRLPCQ